MWRGQGGRDYLNTRTSNHKCRLRSDATDLWIHEVHQCLFCSKCHVMVKMFHCSYSSVWSRWVRWVGCACVCMCVCPLLTVWWQIEGAGRLWGPLTPLPLVAAATKKAAREKKEIMKHQPALLSLLLSGPVLPSRLSSPRRQLDSHRCLLPKKLCFSSLNCFCVTDGKRSNLQPVSTPHISSQKKVKRSKTCLQEQHFLFWISNHSDKWTPVIHLLLAQQKIHTPGNWSLNPDCEFCFSPSTKAKRDL